MRKRKTESKESKQSGVKRSEYKKGTKDNPKEETGGNNGKRVKERREDREVLRRNIRQMVMIVKRSITRKETERKV